MVTQCCEEIDVGTPFYAPAWRPPQPAIGINGHKGAGPPALHKFDQPDFVRRFLGEAAQAAQAQQHPASLLAVMAPHNATPGTLDVDTLDIWSEPDRTRVRKLYQPMHFRFYLAACELRCLVPGLPPPSRAKIKKVELVIRRVALVTEKIVDTHEWAWIDIPGPSMFSRPVPAAVLEMAPRLTGNSRTWWPIPEDQEALEGEQRFPMTRAAGPGLDTHALYFAFVPLASGEMYGPPRTELGPPAARPFEYYQTNKPSELVPVVKPLPSLQPEHPDAQPASPLVPAPSNFALRVQTIASFVNLRGGWRAVLGRLIGSAPVDGPRPKFESPPLLGPADTKNPPGAWGYVIRCVATLELSPGCLVERWGPPTEPAVIAPQFDPFGGRPTRVEVPSISELAQMIPAGTDVQAAGGLGFSIGSGLGVSASNTGVSNVSDKVFDLCFFGIPLITICAYLMFSFALAIIIPIFSFLLLLKFCLGRKP